MKLSPHSAALSGAIEDRTLDAILGSPPVQPITTHTWANEITALMLELIRQLELAKDSKTTLELLARRIDDEVLPVAEDLPHVHAHAAFCELSRWCDERLDHLEWRRQNGVD